MKALLRFAGWATLAFVVSWWIASPYQRALVAVATRLASPPGQTLEPVDLEVFFPFDLGVYVALCAASSWRPWRARLRATGIGLPVLVAAEVLTLVMVIRAMLGMAGRPEPEVAATERFVVSAIRLAGLAAAGCVWIWLLGREPIQRLAAAIAPPAAHPQGRRRR